MPSNHAGSTIKGINWQLDKTVFFGSVFVIVSFIIFTLTNIDVAESLFNQLKTNVTTHFGWLFNLSV